MPVRFRKSFTIFPGVKANVSKSGVSFTVGTKGYHLNFSKRGVKQTVGLPGSGISQSTYLVKNDTRTESDNEKGKEPSSSRQEDGAESRAERSQVQTRRRTPAWVLLLGLVVIYVGALVLGLVPENFLSQVLHTLTSWARALGL